MFATGFMAGVPYMALPIACLVAMEVVEWRLAALRHWPSVAIVRVKAVVNMAEKAMVAMEPWTSSNEDAAVKPVGPVVTVGRAIIGSVVKVSIWAAWFNANIDGDLGRSQG
jgi:hypothetical protein